jgi:hypothetical protein
MISHVFPKLNARLNVVIHSFNGRDGLVFWVIVVSAVLVTAARIVAPFEIRNDQGTQLEVAQRLVEGHGLTTNNRTPGESYDIATVPPPVYLTDWPPGFSVLVAGFLYLGLPLLATLKIIYAAVTLIGWFGWGAIASHFLARPVFSKGYAWIHLIVVALLPILYTPWWGGTDIFLWTGIPLAFMCLFGFGRNQPSLLSIAFAGLLFGLLCAMRYTSLFLGLAAALILFQVTYPHIKTFLKRFAVFLFAASAVMLPVTLFLLRHSQPLNNPDTVASSGSAEPARIWETLRYILESLPVTSNLVVGHPILERIIYTLKTDWLTFSFGIISLIVIVSLPFIVWRSGPSAGLKTRDDMALSFSFLPISVVIFLLAVGLATQPAYLQIRRYYEPLMLCGIFVCYEIAFRRATPRLIKLSSRAIVVMFIFFVCLFLPALALTARKEALAIYVLGFTPSKTLKYQSTSQEISYPSLRLYSRKENSRAKVKELYKENPEALFYVETYGYFIYDGLEGGPVPGRSFRPFPSLDFLGRAFTTTPVKIFWIVDEKRPLRFLEDSNKHVVFSDPFEQIKIVASDFSAGPLIAAGRNAEIDRFRIATTPLGNSQRSEPSPSLPETDSTPR